ncbi:dsDNA nuclease domain-containing protein [Sphingomonas oryzagri]
MPTDLLTDHKPREQSGSQAYRAFDFQVHASMARVLAAHGNGENFRAYFDLFDDLIFIHESASQPAISFFQMKARTGSPWTPNRLANRSAKGDLPKSIIGKSYFNLHQFGSIVRKAAIVSNQHLKAKYPDNKATTQDDGEILLSSLCKSDHDILVDALNLDFPDGIDPSHAATLVYERVPLDIQSFRQTLQGLVTEFVEAIGPEYLVAARSVYQALLSEITRCTGTIANASNLTELQGQKSLGKGDIDALVERMKQRSRTPTEWWQNVAPELAAAGWQAIPIQRLHNACQEYWNARRRGAGLALDLSEAVRAVLAGQPALIGDSILNSAIEIELAHALPEPAGEPFTIRAALFVEIMESLE